MKIAGIVLTLALICFGASAQQHYLLQPADTAGKVTFNESYQQSRITATRIKANRIRRGMEGYRIEIYQGSDREEAQEAFELFKETFPDIAANVVFENPYVKVKVGTYRSKLEAQKLYHELSSMEEFEGVKIVHEQNMRFPKLGCGTEDDDSIDDSELDE